jgi:hypothetical protein
LIILLGLFPRLSRSLPFHGGPAPPAFENSSLCCVQGACAFAELAENGASDDRDVDEVDEVDEPGELDTLGWRTFRS